MSAEAHLELRVGLDRTVDADWSPQLKDEQDSKLADAVNAALADAKLPYKATVANVVIHAARSETREPR